MYLKLEVNGIEECNSNTKIIVKSQDLGLFWL